MSYCHSALYLLLFVYPVITNDLTSEFDFNREYMGILKKLFFAAVCLPFTGAAAQASGDPVEAARDSVVLHTSIYFSLGNGEWIEKSEYRKAGDFLRWALENPEPRILLVGWADKSGSGELNRRLSLRRAVTLSRYLVRKGVAAERITTEGRGVDTGATHDSVARRVDMVGWLPVAVSPQAPQPSVTKPQETETVRTDTNATGTTVRKEEQQPEPRQTAETAPQAGEQTASMPHPALSRWSAGLNVGIPFFWGDMLSMSADKTYVGFAAGIQGGYRISDLLAVSLSVDYARGKLGARGYAEDYLLATDGMTWYVPQQQAMQRYGDLYSKVSLVNVGLSLDVNMNRIFSKRAAEHRFTVWVSPTVYGQFFSADICTKADGKRYSDGTTKPDGLSLGLGGALTLRYRVNRSIDLQLKNSVLWMTDNHFDGIRTPFGKTKHNAAWMPQIGVVWNIR